VKASDVRILLITCVVVASLGDGPVVRVVQGQTAGSVPQPSFRSGVNLVLVDMRVVSGDNPISDLRADEITLLVDGTPRAIVSLDYYSATGDRNATASVSRSSESTPEVRREARTRRIAIVVDRDSIESGEARQVEKAARAFIERLPPLYAVAVGTLPLRNGIRFEADRREAQRALTDAFSGTTRRGLGLEAMSGFGCTGASASSGCGEQGLPEHTDLATAQRMNAGAELQIRGRAVLADLRWLFHALDDGPSDVVLVTGGFADEQRLRPEIDKALAAARAANVHVHSVQIADLSRVPLREGGSLPGSTTTPMPDPRPTSYGLPGETGGLEEVGSASGESFFKRLARELSGAYVLAFEPLPSERDGNPHRIEIRLPQRKHATIRARKVFVLPPPGQPARPREQAPFESTAVAPQKTPPPITQAAPLVTSPGLDGNGHTQALRDLIGRASAYVDEVERSLPSVVVEERYVQVVKRWMGAVSGEGQGPELEWRSDESKWPAEHDSDVLRRRQLLSDVLLVQTPGESWTGYRDVAEVDGKPVRDRAVRVQRLFLSQRADDRRQLQRIADESARMNLGARRNINTPTFPLWILLARNSGRFAWAMEKGQAGAEGVAIVGFSEVTTPTIVRTSKGRNVPLSGQFWIEPASGRVRRATLNFQQLQESVEGSFDVSYGPVADLDVFVPIRLWEWSKTVFAERPAYVEGRASYANIRRFTVNTGELPK
jgi:VWFA-related protein